MDYLDDLNPHAEARFAVWLFGEVYAASGLGAMGFWEQLADREKEMCRDAVDQISRAKREADRNPPLVPRHANGHA